jgi:hypothetical protein
MPEPDSSSAAPGALRPESRTRKTDLEEQSPDKFTRLVPLIRWIGTRVDTLTERLKTCEDELALLSKYEHALEALSPFLRVIQESDELDYLGLTIDLQERHAQPLPLLHELLAKTTSNRYELVHGRVEERTLAVLIYNEEYHAALTEKSQAALEQSISPVFFPIPVARATGKGEPREEYLARLLRRTIGYQLKIKR